MFNYIHIFLIFFLISLPAYSYIDPGSGSIILQVLLGAIVTALIFIKSIFYKIKMKINEITNFLFKTKKKKRKKS